MTKKRRSRKEAVPPATDVRPDLREALEKYFPDGIIEWPSEEEHEEGQVADLYDRLCGSLAGLPGVGLFHEQPADSRVAAWHADNDDDGDAAAFPGSDMSYSYRRYFLGLADAQCEMPVEYQEEDEDGELAEVEGTDTLGCVVALCEFAPLAIVRFDSIWSAESGSSTLPDIGDHIFDERGVPVDLEAHFAELFGDDAMVVARRLREAIIALLQSRGVTIIPDDEARKTVPWLTVGEEVLVPSGGQGAPLAVQDAFFFMLP